MKAKITETYLRKSTKLASWWPTKKNIRNLEIIIVQSHENIVIYQEISVTNQGKTIVTYYQSWSHYPLKGTVSPDIAF